MDSIILIWNNVVYRESGNYYTVRTKLGIPDNAITPWSWSYEGDEWTKAFLQ